MEDASQLKYLECCIKETARLFPSAPLVERKVTEDIELNGYRIPAGTSVTCSIFALHRNKEYFEDPLDFKPDRFLPDQAAGRHPFAYVPFSGGPRNCIGNCKIENNSLKVRKQVTIINFCHQDKDLLS